MRTPRTLAGLVAGVAALGVTPLLAQPASADPLPACDHVSTGYGVDIWTSATGFGLFTDPGTLPEGDDVAYVTATVDGQPFEDYSHQWRPESLHTWSTPGTVSFDVGTYGDFTPLHEHGYFPVDLQDCENPVTPTASWDATDGVYDVSWESSVPDAPVARWTVWGLDGQGNQVGSAEVPAGDPLSTSFGTEDPAATLEITGLSANGLVLAHGTTEAPAQTPPPSVFEPAPTLSLDGETLTWTAVDGAASYVGLLFQAGVGPVGQPFVTAADERHTDLGDLEDGDYYVMVAASDGDGMTGSQLSEWGVLGIHAEHTAGDPTTEHHDWTLGFGVRRGNHHAAAPATLQRIADRLADLQDQGEVSLDVTGLVRRTKLTDKSRALAERRAQAVVELLTARGITAAADARTHIAKGTRPGALIEATVVLPGHDLVLTTTDLCGFPPVARSLPQGFRTAPGTMC